MASNGGSKEEMPPMLVNENAASAEDMTEAELEDILAQAGAEHTASSSQAHSGGIQIVDGDGNVINVS